MEVSDDKVMDILIDTNEKVTVVAEGLKQHCQQSAIKHKSHEERIERLEKENNMEPLDKGVKYYSKKLAPYTIGISMLGYVIYDVYTRLTKGG